MKEKYEFFRKLYEEEVQTAIQLEGRAKVYLSVNTAFLIAVILRDSFAQVPDRSLGVPWWAMLVQALVLGVSLVLIIYALRVRKFESICDAVAVLDDYGEALPPDDEFFEDRIVDLAVASSRNQALNNETARILAWAGWFLIGGMLSLVTLLSLSIVWS